MATPAAAAALISIDAACANAPASTLDDADTTTTPAGESNYGDVIDCLNAPNGYEGEDGAPVLAGNDAGDANFASPVTRAQFAGIFSRIAEAAGLATDETSTTPFTDIDGAFFEGAIRAMYGLGLTEGKTATTYDTQSTLTIAQLATFYVRLIELITGETLPDNGTSEVSGFGVHTSNAEKLFDNGFLTADQASDGTQVATRGDIFAMAARALSHFVTEGILDNPFAPPTNQTFTVTPMTTQVIDSETEEEVVEYLFAGLDANKVYDVYLFPCVYDDEGAQVFSDGAPFVGPDGESRLNGVITFADNFGHVDNSDAPNDIPDNEGSTWEGELDIVRVGNDNGLSTSSAFNYAPSANGTLVVWLAGDGDLDCGIPVVVEDATNNTINLADAAAGTFENSNAPTEKFVVGPATVVSDGVVETGDTVSDSVDFIGAASLFPTGSLGNGDDIGVVVHNHGDGILGIDWDNDAFYYDGSEVEGQITPAQFRAFLTLTDTLETCSGSAACLGEDVPYSRTAQNHWVITTDYLPTAPTGVSAQVGNFDGDNEGVSNDVKVSWSAPTFGSGMGGDVDQYYIEIWDISDIAGGSVDDDSTDEADNLGATGIPTNMTVCNAGDCELEDLPQGTYRARVYAESETDHAGPWSLWSEAFGVQPDPTAPTIIDLDLTTDAGTPGLLDTADVIRAIFSESMVATLGDTNATFIRVSDDDSVYQFECVTNMGCVQSTTNAPNTDDTLTMTLGATAPTFISGTDNGIDLLDPPTISAVSSTFDDLSGNQLNLAGSTDVTIN